MAMFSTQLYLWCDFRRAYDEMSTVYLGPFLPIGIEAVYMRILGTAGSTKIGIAPREWRRRLLVAGHQ